MTDIILETEGSDQNIQKRTLFHYKKVKSDTLYLTFPPVHSLCRIVFIWQLESVLASNKPCMVMSSPIHVKTLAFSEKCYVILRQR